MKRETFAFYFQTCQCYRVVAGHWNFLNSFVRFQTEQCHVQSGLENWTLNSLKGQDTIWKPFKNDRTTNLTRSWLYLKHNVGGWNWHSEMEMGCVLPEAVLPRQLCRHPLLSHDGLEVEALAPVLDQDIEAAMFAVDRKRGRNCMQKQDLMAHLLCYKGCNNVSKLMY